MEVNYKQLYQKFTKELSPKVKDIFDRRFGVKSATQEPETLESIGKSLGITRERVRQIEEAGFSHIRKNYKEVLDSTHTNLVNYFKDHGGFKREDVILQELGGKGKTSQKPYILFLLTIGDQFEKAAEKKDYHSFWFNMPNAKQEVVKTLGLLVNEMQKIGKPVTSKDFYNQIASKQGIAQLASVSYLEVSKKIQSNQENQLGLVDWPEIKPKGVRDRALLAFKKHGKPLHFTEVAKMIDKLNYNMPNKKTYPQTVHNELIKDPRFVLVGRGTYALADWGYTPGTIKEVIAKLLKDSNGPVHKDEIVDKVLAQRMVAKNTVLMNLNNKTHFDKDTNDKYFLRKTQIA
jgi:DNA-directed RNA polymerase delta subunit